MLTSDGASLGFRKPLDKILEAERRQVVGGRAGRKGPWGRQTPGDGERGRQRRQAGWRERQEDLDSREDVQGRQRCQDSPGARGREKGGPEAPGKGDGEPQQTQAHAAGLVPEGVWEVVSPCRRPGRQLSRREGRVGADRPESGTLML